MRVSGSPSTPLAVYVEELFVKSVEPPEDGLDVGTVLSLCDVITESVTVRTNIVIFESKG